MADDPSLGRCKPFLLFVWMRRYNGILYCLFLFSVSKFPNSMNSKSASYLKVALDVRWSRVTGQRSTRVSDDGRPLFMNSWS
jgi:hypothetical protein